MNFGFDDGSFRVVLEAHDEPNRYCVQLYNVVAGAVPIRGLNVLEVGSGRGGGAAFIKRYLKPASVTAVDLSEQAVRFCRRVHVMEGLTFQVGDAEMLPFESNCFDAVVNVESSHCYPHLPVFFKEVARVLKPDGYFLYADFRESSAVDSWRGCLIQSGFSLIDQSEITSSVVRALDKEDERKRKLLARVVPRFLHGSLQDFAALRGSKMYQAFHSGALSYIRFVAQKQNTM